VNQRWLEISVTIGMDEADEVSALMSRWAVGGVAIQDLYDPEALDDPQPTGHCVVSGYLPEDCNFESYRDKLLNALWMLGATGSEELRHPREAWVDESVWSEEWKKYYKKTSIGPIDIVPAWHEFNDSNTNGIKVLIDPGKAFGTGLHVSTRQAIHNLLEVGVKDCTVMDVGTGSGILAITACKLGAQRVLAIDNDYLAVEAALANILLNECVNGVEVECGAIDSEARFGSTEKQYDVLVANIVASVHVELASSYLSYLAPSGVLILGGIVDEREKLVLDAFSGVSMDLISRHEKDRWVSLMWRRIGR